MPVGRGFIAPLEASVFGATGALKLRPTAAPYSRTLQWYGISRMYVLDENGIEKKKTRLSAGF